MSHLSRSRRLSAALLGPAVLASTVVALSAPAAAAPETPAVVSPLHDASVPANPLLDWSPAAGAAKYRVQVSTTSAFTSTLYAADTFATRATPPVDLPLGPLYWRVAGVDSAGAVGAFTAPVQFTKLTAPGPLLLSPEPGAVLAYPDVTPVLTWAGVGGAKSYVVTLADNDAFSGAQTFTTSNTQLALSEPLSLDKAYFWKVRGVSATTSVTTADSELRSFSTTWTVPPGGMSPTDGQRVDRAALSWEEVSGAKAYEVQVSPDGNFTDNLTTLDGKTTQRVVSTRYTPTTALPVRSYFWRVRAVDNGTTAHPGPWTAAELFTVDPLAMPLGLIADQGGSTVSDPRFRWDPVPRATSYELVVSISTEFPATTATQTCTTFHTSFTPYTRAALTGVPQQAPCGMTFLTGERYYWRVRAVDAPSGNPGEWSMTATFVTSALSVPASVGGTAAAPVISWSPVPGYGQYSVTITSSGGQSTTVKTYATSYTPVGTSATSSPVKPDTYTYTVRTLAEDGTLGPAPIAPGSYVLEAPTGTPSIDLLAPASGASGVDMPSMSWTPMTGAAYYVVFYRGDAPGTNLQPLVTSGTTVSKLFLPATTENDSVLPAGDYLWTVVGYSATGGFVGQSAEERPFTVRAPSPVVHGGPCTAGQQCLQHDTPTFTWSAPERVGLYQVTLAADELFTNKLRTWTTQNLTLTPREALPDNQAAEAYYWFVQPCKPVCGPADADKALLARDKRAFKKQSLAVQPYSPADGTQVPQVDEVHFTWEDYSVTSEAAGLDPSLGARSYRLQVATDTSFNNVVDDVTVDQPQHTSWAKAYADGVYYWRVQALDGISQGQTWSEVRTFKKSSTVAVPQPVTTTTPLPTLTWLDPAATGGPARPPAYAGSYVVEVYRGADPSFPSAAKAATATVKYPAFTPSTALPAGEYSWRVRRVDPSGNAGPWWSEVPVFSVTQAPPSLLAPAGAATVRTNDMLFSWEAPGGAAVAAYRFESSTTAGFTSLVESQSTVMQEWAPTAFYADAKTYYWRVRVLDGAGNVLSTSEPRSFLKDAAAPLVGTVPATGVPVVGPLTITFNEPVKGLTTSSVRVRTAGTTTYLTGTVAGSGTSTATWIPRLPLVPGQTYEVVLSSAVTDLPGNPLAPVVRSWRAQTAVESDSPAVTHVWDRDAASTASGGAYVGSSAAGAEVSHAFTGTKVVLTGRLAPDGGFADVYLDGVKKATVSSYGSQVAWKRVLWTSPTLTAGSHILRVVTAAARPTGSSGTWTWVDSLTVTNGTTVSAVEEGVLKQRFGAVGTTSSSGGSHAVERHVLSGDTSTVPEYRVSLRGTSLTITGVRSPAGGQADVLVDGKVVGTVDTYAASPAFKASLLRVTGLTDAVHAVVVRLKGTKVTASTGFDVALDTIGTT